MTWVEQLEMLKGFRVADLTETASGLTGLVKVCDQVFIKPPWALVDILLT